MAGAGAGRKSAGLLAWRRTTDGPEFLLVHPGGPFWRGRDQGAWSVPKGLIDPGEDPLAGALREFREELGLEPPPGPYVRLTDLRQKGGKTVLCWLAEGDIELSGFRSNTFGLEWPRGSGRVIVAPTTDSRYPPYVAAVEAAPSTADVFLRGTRTDAAFGAALASRGIAATRFTSGPWSVYVPSRPITPMSVPGAYP